MLQRLLREGVRKECTHAVIEVSSESTKQFRHLFLFLDALVFTNLAPEHIESHGSFEKYAAAKLRIARALEHSHKGSKVVIANADAPYAQEFLATKYALRFPFSFSEATDCVLTDHGSAFTFKDVRYETPLIGRFNVENTLAAIQVGRWNAIAPEIMQRALKKLGPIRGRVERINAGQDFEVIVDYAHTPDSLKALYTAFPQRKVCVLGNTGGGRDIWKRPEMGKIADTMCDTVILTNEDPYDENPNSIVDAMAAGMQRTPQIIMDRREAIRTALQAAKTGDAILITGKGTDPFIMGPHGTKTPWSDAAVAHEELEKLLQAQH